MFYISYVELFTFSRLAYGKAIIVKLFIQYFSDRKMKIFIKKMEIKAIVTNQIIYYQSEAIF